MVRASALLAALVGLAGNAMAADAINLKVTSSEGNQSSPYLYGAMFEVGLYDRRI